MSKATQFISKNVQDFQQFLRSTDFSKAVLIGIAVTVPIVLGIWLEYFEIGLAICFGAFWSSPSDVSGNQRHKKYGILFSAALAMVVSFIGGYLHYETWLSLPILGVLGFAIAFLSVYGFRASLISFSGLLALVLSFAHKSNELELYQYALLVGVGGLWYLFLSTLWHRINPKKQTEEVLSETFIRTAEFLETRGKLIAAGNDRNELQSNLYELQSELTKGHETLREILIQSRKTSGRSHFMGKRLLIFIELVEMLETAIANPINYDKLNTLLKEYPEYIKSFQTLIFEMARQLRAIAEVGNNPKKLPKNKELTACFEKVQNEITPFGIAKEAIDYERFLMLQSLLEYQHKQFEKLKRIKWLLGNPDIDSKELIHRNESKRFLVAQDYDPKLLVSNLSFRSNIFRHSLRLAVTLMIGYALGNFFPVQNPYWILLTIIIIMRPSYGLTKTRSKDRIIGTLIGGAVASGMVFLIQDPYVYGVLGITSLVFAIAMVQKNYKTSATFVTLSVIFIYAILQPNILAVIQYRILDTLVGAALSYVSILWLWPTWGFLEIGEDIGKSVKSNQNFLIQIADFYQKKGKVPTNLKVARKNAFLETSNLSSAFQRMTQEPKSKQKNLDKIYELVEMNHTFLASLASLSIYIQHHKTTEASEMFKVTRDKIIENLSFVLQSLESKVPNNTTSFSTDVSNFEKQLLTFQRQQLELSELENGQSESLHQESHLIWGQLRWLYSLSNNMLKLTSSLKWF